MLCAHKEQCAISDKKEKLCKCGRPVHRDGRCKICNYKHTHKMPDNKNWSEDEIDIVLESVLYQKAKVLNGIVGLLNNKTLRELVEFLSKELIIGRQEQLVEVQCSYCGKTKKCKEIYVFKTK